MIISIHAAQVGSDRYGKVYCNAKGISIHAAQVGSDETDYPGVYAKYIFQSTLPKWAATLLDLQQH